MNQYFINRSNRLTLCLALCFALSMTMFLPSQASTDLGFKTMSDIELCEPVLLETPSFNYALYEKKLRKNKTISLSVKSSKSSDLVEDSDDWFKKNKLELTPYIVPNKWRNIKGNLPSTIPLEYKGLMLTEAIKTKEGNLLIYGYNFADTRYIVGVDSKFEKVRFAYDFQNYAYAPKNVKEDKEYVYQSVIWANEVDGILYVQTSHATYAKSSFGKNAYVTAIRLSDNKVLWRSQPLVANSNNFEIIGDYIVCGYGFPEQASSIFILNQTDGSVYEKIAVRDMASYIVAKKDVLYVRSYSNDYTFKIITK